jgi:adenosylcobinamide kinase/adenosylcobinamide-phosphate guanylyltransferase
MAQEHEAVPGVTLVLGGARSGKSRFAEGLVTALPGPWIYIATAQAWDEEMRDRIRQHQADRVPGWTTVEAPLDLPAMLARHGQGPVLVDCLTLWLTNVMLADQDVPAAVAALEAALAACTGAIVLVGNEVGMGIVPENALARAFRDHAGRLHQRLAATASQVYLTVAGLPLKVK